MARINVLDKHVAELIAAGEVVERPSSVIKELVENCIDAGADEITVEIQNGGITYMRVTDNGCGIARDDVATAFLRHATSKVRLESDLSNIGTLGFRGEALASIAAVAKVEMITKTADSDGVIYRIAGGEEQGICDTGCPRGTTIIVRDLFYNTPARMKFLKTDTGEGNAVESMIDRIVLSHPEISFKFIRDGKVTVNTQGDGRLISAVYSVYGRDFANGMIETDYTIGQMRVHGLVCKPIMSQKNRNMQHFYVNGRYVRPKTMFAAVEQAYKNSIMVGKFASCVLNLELPCDMVDINVHPAKTEVRFTNEKLVFDAVYYAVKSAIDCDSRPQITLPKVDTAPPREVTEGEQLGLHNSTKKADTEPPKTAVVSAEARHIPARRAEPQIKRQVMERVHEVLINLPRADVTAESVEPAVFHSHSAQYRADACPPQPTAETAPNADGAQTTAAEEVTGVKLIGEAFDTYIIAEYADEIYFIDKHAAHERILFEQLKRDKSVGQQLLTPVTVTLSGDECSALLENIGAAERLGFEIEGFGGTAVLVRSVPLMLSGMNVAEIVSEMADGFARQKHEVSLEHLDWLYHNVACRAAIKAGNKSTDEERLRLAERIIGSDDIRYCPHGRPVAFRLTKRELEKQFGR
ncbi:MAG: DNA mismatch repair endonuclease MutL [Firmicutes bacterium]|nr:DNA mismatch repair endonuclease MutL [Bacillota bacterium]